MVQFGGFLGRLLGPLMAVGCPLMRNILKSLVKSVLTPLGLAALPSAADAGKHKKVLGLEMTALRISPSLSVFFK